MADAFEGAFFAAGLAAEVVVALALAIICLVDEEDNRNWDARRKDSGRDVEVVVKPRLGKGGLITLCLLAYLYKHDRVLSRDYAPQSTN